jgi:hypothetical protein
MKRLGLFLVLIVLGCSFEENASIENPNAMPNKVMVRFIFVNPQPIDNISFAGFFVRTDILDTIKFRINSSQLKDHLPIYMLSLGGWDLFLIENIENMKRQDTIYQKLVFLPARHMETIPVIERKDYSLKIKYTIQSRNSLDSGLVAHYPLNSNSIDISGFRNHGYGFGVKYANDRFGNPYSALSVNKKQHLLIIPNKQNISFNALTDDFTISLWVRAREYSKENIPIIQKWYGFKELLTKNQLCCIKQID